MFWPEPCLAILRRSMTPAKPEARRQLRSYIAEADGLDRIYLDLAFFHAVTSTYSHVRPLPDSNRDRDLATTDALPKPLREQHGTSLPQDRAIGACCPDESVRDDDIAELARSAWKVAVGWAESRRPTQARIHVRGHTAGGVVLSSGLFYKASRGNTALPSRHPLTARDSAQRRSWR